MTKISPIPIKRKPRIGIIGTGRMAFALGKAFLEAGHFVAFGSRRPEKKKEFHKSVGIDSRVYRVQAAIDAGEVVVIALPYKEVAGAAREFADSLRKKIVVDISNPFEYQPNNGSSGAELTASIIGPGARVVAAFKTNFSDTICEPTDSSGNTREVHYAGDDDEAMQIVGDLIMGIGFRPINCGGLTLAVALDHMVPLMIRIDTASFSSSHKSSIRFTGP